MGDQNLNCGVRSFVGPESFAEMRGEPRFRDLLARMRRQAGD